MQRQYLIIVSLITHTVHVIHVHQQNTYYFKSVKLQACRLLTRPHSLAGSTQNYNKYMPNIYSLCPL